MPQDPVALSLLQRSIVVAAGLLLVACASRTPAPVEERRAQPGRAPVPAAPSAATAPARTPEGEVAPTYTVKRGDTLAGIALEHGLDYRELASWNGIENPNRILVGQVLRLAPPGEGGAAPEGPGAVVTTPLRAPPPVTESRATPAPAAPAATARNTETMKVSPKAVKEPYSEAAAREMAKAPAEPVAVARVEPPKPAPPQPAPAGGSPQAPPPAPVPAPAVQPAPPASSAASPPAAGSGAAVADDEDLDWMWPAKGKLVTGFSDTANLKGIDIAGTAGQPIVASAAGRSCTRERGCAATASSSSSSTTRSS